MEQKIRLYLDGLVWQSDRYKRISGDLYTASLKGPGNTFVSVTVSVKALAELYAASKQTDIVDFINGYILDRLQTELFG